jgi:hypothetical protein
VALSACAFSHKHDLCYRYLPGRDLLFPWMGFLAISNYLGLLYMNYEKWKGI